MRLGLSLAVTLLAAFLPGLALADNWPAFRGPTGDGHSTAKAPPTRWSETENVKWKTPIHGKGWSSPVVWGDQVWVTTADEIPRSKALPPPKAQGQPGNAEQVTFFAMCLDRKTGQITQNIKLAVEKDPPFCIDFNSYASPTPTIEEGRVYAHFGSHGTWCLDTATGQVVWERKDLKCDHFRGPGSSPILYKNLLILIFDGFDVQYVAALDKTNGQTVWKTDRDTNYLTDNGDYKKAYATAQVIEVDGRPQLVCPSSECTVAYEPMTGKEIWRLTHPKPRTMNVGSRPVAGHGLMFLTTGNPNQLLAVKLGGSGLLPADRIAWDKERDVPSQPSLLLVNDLLFMMSDAGRLTCMDAKTGKENWGEKLNGEFTASPVYAAGNIYLTNRSGKTFVVAASRDYNLVAANEVGTGKGGTGCWASPALLDDGLFLRTREYLYCIAGK